MSLWLTLVTVAAVSAATKAAGPALLGRRELASGARDVVAHLGPALLAALVVVQTFGTGQQLVVDSRTVGLLGAAVVIAARLPAILAVALAAALTGLSRSLL